MNRFANRTESPAELVLIQALHALGIEPEPQVTITVRGRTIRLDFLIRKRGSSLAIEVDGWTYHRDEEHFVNDRLRDLALLADHGIVTVRIAASTIYANPTGTAQLIRNAIYMMDLGTLTAFCDGRGNHVEHLPDTVRDDLFLPPSPVDAW